MIDNFVGQYRFLSNFCIEPDRTHVEGEYQARKCAIPEDALLFRGKSPYEAKKLGRSILLRPDWESVKLKVMEELVRKKFTDHLSFTHRLMATGNELLVEGNTWGDVYWGVCRGRGQNNLGIILMKIREEFFELA